jgi:hypothetical protein
LGYGVDMKVLKIMEYIYPFIKRACSKNYETNTDYQGLANAVPEI